MPTSRPTDVLESAQLVLGVKHSAPIALMPANACDCHVHVFGPRGRYAFSDDRVFMPDAATVDDLVGLQAALGLDRVVVVQASPQGTDNACLLDTLYELTRRGREARGVAVVPTDVSDSTLQSLQAAGVRGVRVNLQSYGTSDPDVAKGKLREMAAIAKAMGWHVQLYTNLGVIKALADQISRLGAPVVIDHFGLAHAWHGVAQAGFAELQSLVKAGYIHVKLSAPYRITQQQDGEDGIAVVRALIESNVDQMLWGTDWPHTGHRPGALRLKDQPEPFQPIDDGHQFNVFVGWTSFSERQKILVDNPEKLYGFAD